MGQATLDDLEEIEGENTIEGDVANDTNPQGGIAQPNRRRGRPSHERTPKPQIGRCKAKIPANSSCVHSNENPTFRMRARSRKKWRMCPNRLATGRKKIGLERNAAPLPGQPRRGRSLALAPHVPGTARAGLKLRGVSPPL